MHANAAGRLIAALLSFIVILAVVGCVTPPEDHPVTSQVEDWRDEIIYQVMIDRFANGDVNNDFNVRPDAPTAYHGGDWRGLIDQLDYILELGVTALWISPAVKNVEEDAGVASYHGYWTQNFVETNPHFGDLTTLRELVDACHERGVVVILDIVANHIGQLFYYDINRNGQPNELIIGSGADSPITRTTEWDPDFDRRGVQAFTSLGYSGLAPLVWVWQPEINRVPPWPSAFANEAWYNRLGRVTVWGREKDACLTDGIITQAEYDETPYWGDIPACKEYVRLQEVRGDFPGGLKDLNTSLPEVRKALIEAFAYWIEAADFDGFRIDTLKHVEHEFWREFCPAIRSRAKAMGKENFFMFGEAFDSDDELIGSFTKAGGVDSVFYFSQKFQVFDGVFKHGAPTRQIEDLWRYRFPAAGADRHYGDEPQPNGATDAEGNGLEPYRLLVNFLDNHDLPRFLYQDDGRENAPCAPNGKCSTRLCSNADWKETSFCDAEEGRLRCDCDLATLRAALILLFTMDGIPSLYYGTEQDFNGGNDPANREDLWRSGFKTDGETFQFVRRLIALRKQLVTLRRGDLAVVWSSEHTGDEADAGVFAFERRYKGQTALVVMNTNPSKASETSARDSGGGDMRTSFSQGTRLRDLLAMNGNKGEVVVGADGALDLHLEPQSAAVLVPTD